MLVSTIHECSKAVNLLNWLFDFVSRKYQASVQRQVNVIELIVIQLA